MLLHRLLQTLTAIAIAVTVPTVGANVIPRQDSGNDTSSVTLQVISYYIYDAVGKDDPQDGTYPPFVNYDASLQVGELLASCDEYVYSAMNSTGGPRGDCAGVPDVDGLPETKACPPPGDFDGLQGATWTITRYDDRYVTQFNVPDQDDSDRVYVACYEFNKSQFECYPDSNYQWQAVPDSPYTMNLTATVGQVCPTY